MRRVEFDCFSVRFPPSKIEVTVANSISTDLASVTCSKRSLHVFNRMRCSFAARRYIHVNTNKNINVIYVLSSKHGVKDFTLVGRCGDGCSCPPHVAFSEYVVYINKSI